jgi:outer membrane autotransporter protein
VITAAGNITDAGTITIKMPANTLAGNAITVIDAGGGVTDATYNVTNTPLMTFTAALSNANDTVIVTGTAKSIATTASELGISSAQANALSGASTAVRSGDAAALAALTTALNTGGAVAIRAAETLALQADALGAGAAVAVSTGGAVIGVASNRLASLRSGPQHAYAGQTGFATGGSAMSKAVWLKPFGNRAKQDTRKGFAGFDADTIGFSAGVDAEVTEGVRLGGSFASSTTDVTGKGAGGTTSEIESNQFTVYGGVTADKYYVEGMVGYAKNNSDASRTIDLGSLTRTAKADYDSNQYMLSVGGGVPIRVKGGSFFTPTAGLSYTHLSTDSYTETGASNLNLVVSSDNIASTVASLGAKFHTSIKEGNGTLTPSVRGGISYDFSGEEAVATSTFTGGGASFKTTGADVEQFGSNLGVGITYDDGRYSIGANYDAELKSGFVGHSGSLETRLKF